MHAMRANLRGEIASAPREPTRSCSPPLPVSAHAMNRAPQRLSVQVPAGMSAGQRLRVQAGSQLVEVIIPHGVAAGGNFIVEVAAPAAPPVAVAQPVHPGAPSHGSVPMGLPVDSPPAVPAPAVQRQPSPAQDSTALKHAECPICFEKLHKAPVGVFLNRGGRRVSQHFFNLEAANEWLRSGSGLCPLTRQPIASVLGVPDIRADPDGWFSAVDVDGDGRLSRREVVECLKAQLAVDNAALDAAVEDRGHWMWQQWDKDGNGYIERNELLEPQGLAAYVRTAFHKSERELIPEISTNRTGWFEYWDEDCSGSLDKEEVVRALLKTLKLTADASRVSQLRSSIDAIWPVFDSDGSGVIEKDEFLLPGEGLADMIIATCQAG